MSELKAALNGFMYYQRLNLDLWRYLPSELSWELFLSQNRDQKIDEALLTSLRKWHATSCPKWMRELEVTQTLFVALDRAFLSRDNLAASHFDS